MRTLKIILTALIILWGLLALAARVATPLLADYRQEIAARISASLGTPVAIKRVNARWYGLTPLLEFDGVRIGRGEQTITASHVAIELVPGALVRGGLLDALRVTFDGIALTLVREPAGQLHIEGFGALQGKAAGSDGGAAPIVGLPQHLRLLNTRLRWIDHQAGRPPLLIEDLAVVFDREGDQLDLRASITTEAGEIQAAARIDGYLATTDWDGDTYLRIDGLDVARLFADFLPPSYGLHSLQLDLETWGRWEAAAPVAHRGRFELRDLDLSPATTDSRPLKVQHAAGQFTFERLTGGMQLGLKDLVMTRAGRTWPAGNLAFSLSSQADGRRHLAAAADYLLIEDIVRILQVRLPWGELENPLEQLRPRGEIRDLALVADLSPDDFSWRARARFAEIGVAPWDKVPGVERLSGELHGQQDHLVLRVDSRAAKLEFADLFRDPLEFDRLNGRLDLTLKGQGWQISGRDILAVTPHIQTRTRLRVEQQPGQAPFLDLQIDFAEGDAAFASRYYPVGVMKDKLVDWLDRSIKSGRVTQGSALLFGALDDFAFERSRSGVFQVAFDTEDLVLDYRPGWPPLDRLAAQVKFHGNQLDIKASSARIYDSQATDIRARIASLKPTGPLRVRGRVTGPLQDKVRILNEEALRPRFGKFAEVLQTHGDSVLDLDFTIPLSKKRGSYALDGKLYLREAELRLPDWDYSISQANGRLDFTLDGLSAEGIEARTLNTPVRIDVLPLGDGTTKVRAAGRLATDDIARQLPALPLHFATGSADFDVDVDIPAARADAAPIVLGVASDLVGIDIELPAPLGKTAAEAKRLEIQFPLGARPAPGSLAYADQVSARFTNTGQRVDVVFGGAPATLPDAAGIRLSGHLPEVDVTAWGEALQAFDLGDDGTAPPLTLDLRTGRLQAENLSVDDLQLQVTHDAGRWQGAIEAPDMAGGFTVPQATQQAPIRVDLERLKLTLEVAGEALQSAPVPDATTGPDPARLPGLVITIADLRINDAKLGRLQLTAEPAAEGLQITELSLRDGQLQLDSAGLWSTVGVDYQTAWGGRITTPDLGDLLVDLGYSRQIEQAASDIEFLLRWPGSPVQGHRQTARGDLSFNVGTGRVVELDPGVTRLVGLLNINALTRRLRLDFSDFYKKGYSFDSIVGDFALYDGIATTDNVKVVGPTGRIEFTGSADLVGRTVDHLVTVTPDFGATLPIAGTIAGGPIAGLAVLMAQKAMDKQVDAINRFEYRLTGPLGNPTIEPLGTGGTLSKILGQGGTGPEAPAADSPDTGVAQPPQPPPAGPPSAEAAPAQPAPQDPVDVADETPPDAVDTTGKALPETPDKAPASKMPAPLRGLIDFLKKGQSHGGDIPGTDE